MDTLVIAKEATIWPVSMSRTERHVEGLAVSKPPTVSRHVRCQSRSARSRILNKVHTRMLKLVGK